MAVQMLVNIDVPEIAPAEAFYVLAFGLHAGRRFGPHALELLGGGAPIYLLAKRAATRANAATRAQRDYARHWTPVHLDFAVEDVDAAVARAVAAGATLESPPAQHRWGRIAMLADPFGHGICLLQFTGRGYDEVADPA